MELTCFVIIPSNRMKGKADNLLLDTRWGLIEYPTGCKQPKELKDQIMLNFDTVYKLIIKLAINELNEKYKPKQISLKCIRGLDLAESGDIVAQLMKYICTADITITDVTANNPNVYMEYGIRLSVKDELNIMICHENVKLPFDIQQLRCIYYSTDDLEMANQAKNKIVDFISTFIEKRILNLAKDKYHDTPGFGSGDASFYKRQVELYSRRQQERKLLKILEKAPNFIAALASCYFTNEKKADLKRELFIFLDDVGSVLREDPIEKQPAINYYELISRINGLSQEKLEDVYGKLAQICDEDPNFKGKAKEYRELLKKLEE